MILRQLLLAKCVEYIVLFEKLLCDLQCLVVERKPGVLTDDTQYLRISQVAAASAYPCRGSWRQKASAYTRCFGFECTACMHCKQYKWAVLPAESM